MILSGKTIAVCVTGGIAAYKACEIVSSLKKLGADVHVIMTQNAINFVAPLTFETLSGNKVVTKNFDPDREWEVEHVSLAKKCDIFVIAPCTANVIGKLATGIADDFLSTTVMAFTKPVLIAPAMNVNMYNSASYKQNEDTLIRRGFLFVEPESGVLACGDEGKGRLASPHSIVDRIVDILKPRRDYVGKTVLVTLGSTREYIDPVRFITNASSGKMGLSIINAAMERGADVIAICGYVSVQLPKECTIVRVTTTEEMLDKTAEYAVNADVIIMAAAPSDYKPVYFSHNKIKSGELHEDFIKNPDIAATIGKVKGKRKLVVFAAETQNLVENAKRKLIAKNADMAVANDVTESGAGFDVDTNVATIVTRSGEESLPMMTKARLADVILDKISDVC